MFELFVFMYHMIVKLCKIQLIYVSNKRNTNKIIYLYTENISNQTISSLVMPTTRIKSMYFHYPYCYATSGMVSIQLSKEKWQDESEFLSYYDGSVPIRAHSDDGGLKIPTEIFKNSKRVLQQILKYPDQIVSEIELTNIVFTNNTLKIPKILSQTFNS